MSNVGIEEGGCVQKGQEPPLPLELFPARALPRTKDRKGQITSHHVPVTEQAQTGGADSWVDQSSQVQDYKEDEVLKEKPIVALKEENDTQVSEVEDVIEDVQGKGALTNSESKDNIAEMQSACANTSRKKVDLAANFLRPSSKENSGRELCEEIEGMGGENMDIKSTGGGDRNYEEVVLVKDLEGKTENNLGIFCNPHTHREYERVEIPETPFQARVGEAADALQSEDGGVKDAIQASQEGARGTNVAILLAATSDRRRFLKAVEEGGKMGESEEKEIEDGVTGNGSEIFAEEDLAQLDVSSGVKSNLRMGKNLERSSQSQSSNGRRENESCQQPSSLGSSLVGESVGSWLATTSDDLLAINTTKESVVDEKNTSVKESKKKSRVSFSNEVTEIMTYSPTEYDRRNRDVDPASAAAEWELEKSVAKLDTLQVDLERGGEGLGLAIIGLGAEVELGHEKLGIFVRSVTPGGVAARDGRIMVGDQIIEVNGQSLVGVTQAHAASVLRAALGKVSFLIGRERVAEVQAEESQTTVAPESSALEDEESVLGLNLSSKSSSGFEVEGGISLFADTSVNGEGNQVDELESGFIQQDESLSGLVEEQNICVDGDQLSMVIIEEESVAVAQEDQQEETKEALVLEGEEVSAKVEEAAEVEMSLTSDHEETGGCLERSLAEKYLGLVMELSAAKKQVESLQKLLKRREEEFRVKMADLTARTSCVKCREVLMKDGGPEEVTVPHSSSVNLGMTKSEVATPFNSF